MVKLRKRRNKDGTITPYLDIYHDGQRKYEFLSELRAPSCSGDILATAKKIAQRRTAELAQGTYGLRKKDSDFLAWANKYLNEYTKGDKRIMQAVIARIGEYQRDTRIGFFDLNEDFCIRFKDYLLDHHTGEGAKSYFARFKKLIKAAVRQQLLPSDPTADIKIRAKAKRRDTLTLDELKLLAVTHCDDQIKRAFILSCMTGLRWCDVSTLKWSDINLDAAYMVKEQVKTGEDAVIPLNSDAIKMLGEPPNQIFGLVFDLPSATTANNRVKAWLKAAGINKKVTWHQGRHSFGTNLALSGADIKTIANLLGHQSFRHSGRYVRWAKEITERAVEGLQIGL